MIAVLQFPILCLVMLSGLFWLKPWRMKAAAEAVVLTVFAVAYLVSFFVFVEVHKLSWLWMEQYWTLILVIATSVPVLVYFFLKKIAKNGSSPRVAEKVLTFIGSGIFIATFIAIVWSQSAMRMTRIRHEVSVSTSPYHSAALLLFVPFLFLLGLGVLLSFIRFFFPESAVGQWVAEKTRSFFTVLFLASGIFMILGLILEFGFAQH